MLSRNDEPLAATATTPAILVTFVVRNDSAGELPLGELSLRYYFSKDNVVEPSARCDQSRALDPSVCEGVAVSLGELETAFADTVAEFRFPAGAVLASGADTAEIPIIVEPTGGALFQQSNDYSFANNTALAVNSNVTLYRKGVLIGGDEPR